MKPMDGTGTQLVSLGPVLKAELDQINHIRDKRKTNGVKFDQGHPRKAADAPVAGATSQPKPDWQNRDTELVRHPLRGFVVSTTPAV
jgi:hypothetical protein